MHKILKLFAVLTIITPLTTNVIACGGNTDTPPEPIPPTADVITLLNQAEQKVNELFGQLISDNQYIFRPSIFNQQDSDFLLTEISKAPNDEEITNHHLVEPFFNLIKKNVKDFSIKLSEDETLKQLFYGININEILTFDDSNSVIIKDKFDEWKKGEAWGIDGYTPEKYCITDWNKLRLNLNLELKYINQTGDTNSTDIKQKHETYFVNQKSQVEEIFLIFNNNYNKKLENYVVSLTNKTKKYDIYLWHYFASLKPDLETEINKYIDNPKVKIETTKFKNVGETCLTIVPDRLGFGGNDAFKFKQQAQLKTTYLNTGNSFNKKFTENIKNWEGKDLLPQDKLDNVSFVGTLEITNWKYEDIVLKPCLVKTAVIENETRTSKMNTTISKISNIFALSDGLLKNKITFDDKQSKLNITLNKNDFENYIENGNTFGDILTYLAEKIKLLAKQEEIIDNEDFINTRTVFNNPTKFENTVLKNKLNKTRTIATYTSIANEWQDFSINFTGYEFIAATASQWNIIKGDDDTIWPT